MYNSIITASYPKLFITVELKLFCYYTVQNKIQAYYVCIYKICNFLNSVRVNCFVVLVLSAWATM